MGISKILTPFICLIILSSNALLLSRRAEGHANSISFSEVYIHDDRVIFNLQMYVADLWQFVWLDTDNNGFVDEYEIYEKEEEIRAYVFSKVRVKNNTLDLVAEPGTFAIVRDTGFDTTMVIGVDMDLIFPLRGAVGDLNISCSVFEEIDYAHQSYAMIHFADQEEEFIFFRDNKYVLRGDVPRTKAAVVRYFILSGLQCVLSTPVYAAFLLSILLLAVRRREFVQIFAAFSIAQLIAVGLALFEVLLLSGRFVESVIALSIAYMAIENFFVPTMEKRWLITFFFGLIFGFFTQTYIQATPIFKAGFYLPLLVFLLSFLAAQGLIHIGLLLVQTRIISRIRYRNLYIKGVSVILFLYGGLMFLNVTFRIDLF